jgi:hypothetical protein
MVAFMLCCPLQFPAVNHPQSLERRYLGILNSVLLDLMKVREVHIVCTKIFFGLWILLCLHVAIACFGREHWGLNSGLCTLQSRCCTA